MSIYTKKQQTRTVTNKETGETKTFKSTGVDAKGKHFFTSSDSAKIEKFLSGKDPSIKTGLPVGKTATGALGVMTGRRGKNIPRGDITKKMNKGGEVTSEFRMGGKVDISNFKGQF